MFSGIVAGMGRVEAVKVWPGGRQVTISLGSLARGLKEGDSVSVNGVCLTAVTVTRGRVSFNVIAETLKKTNLGELGTGSRVNIERSLRLSDALEGHLVQGHIQGVAKVVKKVNTANEFTLTFKPPRALMPYLAPLGSVAVNGVSLTIADVTRDRFKVALIPTTLERTNLGFMNIGDKANIETDMMARQIVHYLERTRSRKR